MRGCPLCQGLLVRTLGVVLCGWVADAVVIVGCGGNCHGDIMARAGAAGGAARVRGSPSTRVPQPVRRTRPRRARPRR